MNVMRERERDLVATLRRMEDSARRYAHERALLSAFLVGRHADGECDCY